MAKITQKQLNIISTPDMATVTTNITAVNETAPVSNENKEVFTMMKRNLNQETINQIIALMRQFDTCPEYIDNYRQYLSAVNRNKEIKEELVPLVTEITGYSDVQEVERVIMWLTLDLNKISAEKSFERLLNRLSKEEEAMKANTTTNNETNNTVNGQEVMNMTKTERMMNMMDTINNVTKTTDERYVKKEDLVQFLFDNDIICRMPSKNEIKRTKREVFVDILDSSIKNLINAGVITPVNATPVEVGDLDITHDNAPANLVMDNHTMQLKKTDEMFRMIKEFATNNKNKGFGYTVSAKMLVAIIIECDTMFDANPIKKLYVPKYDSNNKVIKDRYGKTVTEINPMVTEEHKNKAKNIRNWLITKGFISTAVFKDEKGFAFYTSAYDGNGKDKMYDATKYLPEGTTNTSSYRVNL